MASRTRNAGRTAFLPPEAAAFVRRRLQELGGIALFLCGAALTVAVVGFDSSDPSWSHAVAREAANPLGRAGAWVSDLLIQSIGAVAILPGIALMVWGWRFGAHRDMGRLWVRVTALPVALIAGLAGLAMLPVLQSSFSIAFRGAFSFGALITFLVTVAGVSIFGIGSAFWGLVIGYTVSRIVEREDFRRARDAALKSG